MSRLLYRLLLWLHPHEYREKFAKEMVWVFDRLRSRRGVMSLLADGAISLVRQWFIGVGLWKPLVGLVLASIPIFSVLHGVGHQQQRFLPGFDPPSGTCELPPESVVALDLRSPADQMHLTEDALAAEDIAIRYADRTHGPCAKTIDVDLYVAARKRCMTELFDVIAGNHEVSRKQVLESLTLRRMGSDLAVFLPFALLYVFVAFAVAKRLRRRFPLDEGLITAGAVILVSSLLASTLCVFAGEAWAFYAESVRIGNGHLSYRAMRIPWIYLRSELFACGVLAFWLIAVFRYWVGRDDPGIPEPPTSLLQLKPVIPKDFWPPR